MVTFLMLQVTGGGVTKDMLSTTDTCIAFVHELWERLQAPGAADDATRQAVQAVVDSAKAILQGTTNPELKPAVRRVQDKISAVSRWAAVS
jgi:hypothetical protein